MKKHNEKLKAFFWIGLGTFCAIYFLAAAAFRVTFSRFFALAAVFFFALGILKLTKYEEWLKRKFGALVKLFRVLIILFVISFIIIEAFIIYNGTFRENKKADYLVILGAGLWGDTPSLVLTERLDAALQYVRLHPDTKIVLSGGKGPGETITEAEAMKRYLVKNGVDENSLIMEERSRSTEENLSFTMEILRKVKPDNNISIMIVTNNFHEFRAQLLARREGFTAYKYSAELHPLLIPAYYVREYFAVVKSLIFD